MLIKLRHTKGDTKKRRVRARAGCGPYYMTFEAVWGAIPAPIIEQLPSRLLIKLVNAMEHQWQAGSSHRAIQIKQEFADYGRIIG